MSIRADSRQHEVEAAVETQLKQARSSAEASFEELIAQCQTPGISLAVIDEGQVAWREGYGVRQYGQHERVTPETRFQAASISKPTATLGVLRMAEAGLLDLDEDVHERLKSWHLPTVNGAVPRITPRMLVSHSAGLSVHGFVGYTVDQPQPTLPDILNGTGLHVTSEPVRLVNLPDLTYDYSGGGYTLLQLWLEDVTGENFSSLMQRWVLEPLGMTHSAFVQPPTPEFAARCASGHHYDGLPILGGWHVYPELAAAGLWTTPSDLATLAMTIQAAHRGEHPFISKHTADLMLTPHIPMPEADQFRALGFQVQTVENIQYFSHSGSNAGFRCQLNASADDGRGYIVMTNGEGEWTRKIIGWFADAIKQVYVWPAAQNKPDQVNWNLDPTVTGQYKLGDQLISIDLEADTLRIQLPDQPVMALRQTDAATFQVEGLSTIIRFVAGSAEQPLQAMHIEQVGRTLTAYRV